MKKIIWKMLNKQEQAEVLKRPATNIPDLREKVEAIVKKVKNEGDSAVKKFTLEFDSLALDNFKVSLNEIRKCFEFVDEATIQAFKMAIERIREYHENQIIDEPIYERDDVICTRQCRAIKSVGLYVPGGSAPLISTLMMLAIPSWVAGCEERILCTPANEEGLIDPNILVASVFCNINKIYKIGGAQAIAAMAFGTESIPKVNKIFGPGNAWVTMAKQICSEDPEGASQDLPAGPSEVMVIADNNANAEFIAWDLLSQAEHGPDSQVILVSTDSKLIDDVADAIKAKCETLDRKKIIKQALEKSSLIKVEDLSQAIEVANTYAPEHLILQIENPESYVEKINAAGSVFLGPWTPESLGDYITGSNHVLPTYGYAKSYSGLSLNDFMKTISIQKATKQGLAKLGPSAALIASLEGLTAHEQAIKIRLA